MRFSEILFALSCLFHSDQELLHNKVNASVELRMPFLCHTFILFVFTIATSSHQIKFCLDMPSVCHILCFLLCQFVFIPQPFSNVLLLALTPKVPFISHSFFLFSAHLYASFVSNRFEVFWYSK